MLSPNNLTWLAAAAVSLLISACGGGGGSTVTAAPLSSPYELQSTSYLNFKNNKIVPQELPVFGDARAYGNFSSTTNPGLLTAKLQYNRTNYTPDNAPGSLLQMWEKDSVVGSFKDVSHRLSSQIGCVHPRKALTGDFNSDKIADIFIACHGYDGLDFSGERSIAVMSESSGTFNVQFALPQGYWHGATAFDIDGDEDLDLVMINARDPERVVVYLNDGHGNFTRDSTSRIPPLFGEKGYYSIEAVDVNRDGSPDILVGGHEYDNAETLLLLNPGDGNFGNVQPVILPVSNGFGVVLDFTFTDDDRGRQLWVMRTGDNPSYEGRALQRIDLDDLSSSLAYQDPTGQWIRWTIPTDENGVRAISSDRKQDDFSVVY